ncbi:hypothetical protein [Corynebacterium doosanense]|uniref:Or membrane protein n=1 Tax=Corynebacterium doosanense CAU 212 = DSM 45436 TaxID=558173 RepID=A0A097IJK6_9CORY|nr:hypothetical protein [Corynebacterium doosanense]AIT62295.1 hypothetical protein CDOO_08800 [Corynebacterium doosanense CAU 212 = DSM 45436]
MRNLRTAVLSLVTAATVSVATVSVAGVSVASAAPDVAETDNPNTVSSEFSSHGSSLWEIGDGLQAEEGINAEDLFGEETVDDAPAWATEWVKLTIAAGVATLAGAAIGVVNYLKYTGVLPR